MDEIRPWLFIGKYRDTLQLGYLRSKSIQAMLQLAENVEQPDITSFYLPVEDFAPLNFSLLEKGLNFIREQKKLDKRVLVTCGAGINRSSAFCTAALKEEEGLSLFDAFREVKKRHPESMPDEPVWVSLCNYYDEKISYLEVMRLGIGEKGY
jgi:Dual specificity phosphatase, catalytic domain